MKTINDIKVEKTFYNREKDAFGNVVREPYKQKVPRVLVFVNPGVRLGYFILDCILFCFLFLVGVILFFSLLEVIGVIELFKYIYSEVLVYFMFYLS